LRVICDNGTESDVLQRSFQRALHRDEVARLVTNPSAGPLFGDESAIQDLATGTIYVLRSKSENPIVATNREILHKIGVTGGKVKTRLVNASLEATFLLADVEVVANIGLLVDCRFCIPTGLMLWTTNAVPFVSESQSQ
jgi:hypothetical protein